MASLHVNLEQQHLAASERIEPRPKADIMTPKPSGSKDIPGVVPRQEINPILWTWITLIPPNIRQAHDLLLFHRTELHTGLLYLHKRLSDLIFENNCLAFELSRYPTNVVRDFTNEGGVIWDNIPRADCRRFGISEKRFIKWFEPARINWLYIQSEADTFESGRGLRDAIWAGAKAWEGLSSHVDMLRVELDRLRKLDKEGMGCVVQ